MTARATTAGSRSQRLTGKPICSSCRGGTASFPIAPSCADVRSAQATTKTRISPLYGLTSGFLDDAMSYIKSIKMLVLLSLALPGYLIATEQKIFRADCRQRPPEMIVSENTGRCSGPLIGIFDEAARQVGYTVDWRTAPFQRSYKGLQLGSVDIVPRVILTEERKTFVAYLGPIGYQQKDIVFLVRKGQESQIKSYDDLRKLNVGTKRDTAYFKRFNADATINKVLSLDDENMVKMFAANRFDAMIILDVPAVEKALKDIGFSDYAYADYRYVQEIGNYYGMSKKSRYIGIYPDLNAALLDLVESGRVQEIYTQYGVLPPRSD
jgi:polar amino acid transport system substrate-binding protein